GAEVETGKHRGDDLAEGKPTLPLIHVMRNGTPEQAACVRHAIENGGRDDFQHVLAAIRATGALEFSTKCARVEADLAVAAIAALPASHYKDSLLELCSFAVARSF
ncbi:polyprenyl synthetase family protein, partial [bacterium]|nr:polyprenyl synthetase family protein [bacterium]